MSCITDPLVNVPKEEWFALKDYFKENWPFGLTAYSTILAQHFNIKKDPNYSVKVFSVFGNPDNGVVCIWDQLPNSFEISVLCVKDDTSKITEALVKTKQIDWSITAVFYNIMKEHVKCCVDALNQLGRYEIKIDDFYIVYVEDEIALKYEVELPEGFSLQVVPPEKAEILDNEYPHRHPGSLNYFKKMLSRGEAIGLVNNNNDLIAWGLTDNRGNLHAITTKPKYRRNGFAKIITKTISKTLSEQGRKIYGGILLSNEPSKNMFAGLGFKFPGVFTRIVSEPKTY